MQLFGVVPFFAVFVKTVSVTMSEVQHPHCQIIVILGYFAKYEEDWH